MIGTVVKVIVDRPLGSYHPEHKDLYYPINYGYVEGYIAPDGEEQDAYILGVNKAVKEVTGTIIAIILRYVDVEEKWMVTGRTGRADEGIQTVCVKMGERSFPNKRILRNNLCLPACRVLMYKRMTLEI